MMKTKLSELKDQAAIGNWRKAIAIAARFPDLGTHRNAILDAHTAFTNPRWVACLKKDADALIAAGILALCDRYGI